MSKKNGNGLIYKDGCVYRDGKLIGIGFKEGEHIPRASDYKLPKKLDAKTKRLIETSQAVMEQLRKAREKREKASKQPKATSASNGYDSSRLPKASDFKLPKKLSAAAKRRIETSRVILEGFRKVREGEAKSEE